MAKIRALPATAIISGFKGVIDYYVHRGIPCVRSWPRSPGKKRSAAVEAQWPTFAYSTHFWNYLPPEIQAAYNSMAMRGGLNGRDLAARAYLSGLYTYPTGAPPPPPVIYLDDLLDVEVPTPSDGQILTWEAATSLWKAK